MFNHKFGGDEKEKFKAREVDPDDRTKFTSDAYDIEGWTKFTFPGRGDKVRTLHFAVYPSYTY